MTARLFTVPALHLLLGGKFRVHSTRYNRATGPTYTVGPVVGHRPTRLRVTSGDTGAEGIIDWYQLKSWIAEGNVYLVGVAEPR